MKLTIEKHTRRSEAFIETPLGRIGFRDWLRKQVDPYKQNRKHGSQRSYEKNYLDLLIEAEVDHSLYYQYITDRIGFTATILRVVQACGYEIHIVKKRERL